MKKDYKKMFDILEEYLDKKDFDVDKTVLKAVEGLESLYPTAICSLNYTDAFQLLIATRLSAQCTDARVNLVTPALFARLPDADAFANAEVEEIEELIKRPQYPAPKFWLNPEIKDFYKFTTDDIKITDYVTGEQIKNIPIAI